MNVTTISSCDVISATCSGGRASPEAVFQRLVAGRDLEHLAAQSDDRCDQVGHAVWFEIAERQLITLIVDFAEAGELAHRGPIEPGHTNLDGRPAQQLVHGSRGDHATVVDDSHAIAYLLHLAQQVRVEEHRSASGCETANDLTHVVTSDRVERGCGFIEKHELRLAKQRRSEAEPLLHPFRKGAHAVAGAIGEAHRVERRSDLVLPARAGQRRQLAVKSEHLAGR